MKIIQNDKQSTITEIGNYVDAGYTLIYLYTSEEPKTLKMLEEAARKASIKTEVYVFDISEGLHCISGEDKRLKYEKRVDIYAALDFIRNSIEKTSFVVFKDIHNSLQSDHKLIRAFKNCLHDVINKREGIQVTIFILSPVLHIPQEIEKEAVVIDIPLPSRKEIADILDGFLKSAGFPLGGLLKAKFIEALNGLTETEIGNILNYCLVEDSSIDEKDLDKIVSQKKQLIRKGGILEFVSIKERMENIGGLATLKKWLENKKMIFDKIEAAREDGVDTPKGILLFGMPGCGKSLAAKAVATYFEMPLLRLDMGMILGPYVGQSEENMRKAIKLAESIAPSVLWIDELEKAFVGVGKGGGSSEVSTRIFGTILTWMQEKTKPVFVVATANSISEMPPEFMRKGRFDEIFSVGFPKGEEIKAIFKVHLGKRNKGGWVDLIDEKITSKIKDFSGAEIEAIVKEVIEEAFINKERNEKKEISTDDFIKKIEGFKPLSETMKDEIEERKKNIKKINCKDASGGIYE